MARPTDTTILHEVDSLCALAVRMAEHRPDAPALVDGDTILTYSALLAQSEALASRLRSLGVGRGSRVGLLLPRGLVLPVAILATLRAGAAYVPLDPDYPAERVRYVAADAGIEVVVGAAADAAILDEKFVVIAPEGTVAAAAPDVSPADAAAGDGHEGDPDHVGPDDPAYVVYTSGSTGRPKGCVVTHGNVLALLQGALPLFELGPEDRWTLFHSASFDFSVWELWGALATGAAGVVVPFETARLPEEFVDLLVAQRVTVLNQVPSVFRSFVVGYEERGRPPLALRYLVFGGESVDLDVTRTFLERVPAPPVAVNMYGITEITVHATFCALIDDVLAGDARSPIGTPLPHLQIELREGDDAVPVPDGEIGEMWVFGDGVAAGYLGRPELTAERFATVDGRRSYRTGDLARRLPTGGLDYRGRNDQQVKLRGFRVELGEVEAALREAPGIRDVAATVTTAGSGARFLIACLVTSADTDPGPLRPRDPLVAALREHALGRLPAHMVPDRYVVVPALPLTASGKLDRAALEAHAQP